MSRMQSQENPLILLDIEFEGILYQNYKMKGNEHGVHNDPTLLNPLHLHGV